MQHGILPKPKLEKRCPAKYEVRVPTKVGREGCIFWERNKNMRRLEKGVLEIKLIMKVAAWTNGAPKK